MTGESGARFWRGTASVPDLYNLLARFLGAGAAESAFAAHAASKGLRWPDDTMTADAELVHSVEVQLAGTIGAASARVMVASVDQSGIALREVHRFVNRPVETQGTLYWDALALWAGTMDGLRIASRGGAAIAGIGVSAGINGGLKPVQSNVEQSAQRAKSAPAMAHDLRFGVQSPRSPRSRRAAEARA